MSKFRKIQLWNYLILVLGIGLSTLSVFLFMNDLDFPILLMTGASGAVAVSLGVSLIYDMQKYRDYLREVD